MAYHSRARNSAASKGKKTLPSYASPHGPFDPDPGLYKPYRDKLGYRSDTTRYVKREILPIPPGSRTSGIVGPEPDISVRGRNLPIIFCKQIRHAAGYWRMDKHPVWRAIHELFTDPNRTLSGAERPNAGCHQTRRWTDAQVQTWTKLANWLGIEFSGHREYSFPKGSLGVVRHGSYHHNDRTLGDFPWPGTRNSKLPRDPPKFTLRTGKRSELSRLLRSLRRYKKAGIEPRPLTSLLKVRKIYSHRTIDKMFEKNMPISEFRKSIPNCLSLTIGAPAQVPDIVLDSLRTIYSRPKKFFQDQSWISPNKASYELQPMRLAPRNPPREKARLIAYLDSSTKVFRAMATTGANLQSPLLDYKSDSITMQSSEFKTIRENYLRWNKVLEEEDHEYQPGNVLGGWFD